MDTLIAYSLLPGSSDRALREGRRRVEDWYEGLGDRSVAGFAELTTPSAGICIWWNSASTGRWPAWHADGRGAVATLNAPVGFESSAVTDDSRP